MRRQHREDLFIAALVVLCLGAAIWAALFTEDDRIIGCVCAGESRILETEPERIEL